jgi:hypothetical protein
MATVGSFRLCYIYIYCFCDLIWTDSFLFVSCFRRSRVPRQACHVLPAVRTHQGLAEPVLVGQLHGPWEVVDETMPCQGRPRGDPRDPGETPGTTEVVHGPASLTGSMVPCRPWYLTEVMSSMEGLDFWPYHQSFRETRRACRCPQLVFESIGPDQCSTWHF